MDSWSNRKDAEVRSYWGRSPDRSDSPDRYDISQYTSRKSAVSDHESSRLSSHLENIARERRISDMKPTSRAEYAHSPDRELFRNERRRSRSPNFLSRKGFLFDSPSFTMIGSMKVYIFCSIRGIAEISE